MFSGKDFESTSSSLSKKTRMFGLRETPSGNLIRSEFESLVSESSDDEEKSSDVNAVRQERSGNLPSTSNPKPRMDASDNVDEIILSVIWNNNRLGAAYYNLGTSQLFVMDDIHDDLLHFNIMKALYRQCQPRYVVAIAGTSDGFMSVLKKLIIQDSPSDDSTSTSSNERAHCVALKMMPKDHNYERCYHRVRCLRLNYEPENVSAVERFTFLNSILNFKSQAMIHALGSLLMFLDKHWNNIALDLSGKPSFVSLYNVMLQDLVMVDEDTYKALSIVQPRHHPSSFKFGKTATQGLSLFSFLNRCQSRPGVQFLWKTLHHPRRNVSVLNQRLDTIEFFMDPENQSVVENLSSCLKHVHRPTNALVLWIHEEFDRV